MNMDQGNAKNRMKARKRKKPVACRSHFREADFLFFPLFHYLYDVRNANAACV